MQPMGDGSKEVLLEVKEGATNEEILQDLEENDLIVSAWISKVYLKIFGSGTIYAGAYQLNDGMSLQDILSYMAKPENGQSTLITLSIPEGTWAKTIALYIEQLYPSYTQKEVLDKWNDVNYIKELAQDYEFIKPELLSNSDIKVKLEGYLYPETYFLSPDATIDEITRTILDQFNEAVYEPYKDEIAASDYTFEEVLTLASMVQFESGTVEDMPIIAEVFYNRLDSDMLLQSSVTVCYALYDEFDSIEACETNTDIDSPYNTYLNKGLPISPILNPGLDAIKATLEPDDNDYLYFAADVYGVSEENPYGVFYSSTYEEHQQICQELQLYY
jgi:UPF0755 protein